MAIRFFHTPKNKKFDFSPRYYDEQKEDLQRRVEQIRQEMGVKEDDPNNPYVSKIRKGQMKGFLKKAAKQKKQSNGRLFLILIILAAAVYFLLYF
jgi:hypothetical protein